MNLSKQIRELLFELGLPCIEKQVNDTPTYTIYHYDLCNIEQLNLVAKKTKFLSAYLHIDIQAKRSNIGHFALYIPKADTNKIDFCDSEYSYLFSDKNRGLDLFIGVNDEGIPQTIKLEDMPHILVAGTTGSGKSRMLHTMICSILNNRKDINTRFYMIDTKRIELSSYRKLGRNCNVATSFEDAIDLLDTACRDIEFRYECMEESNSKDFRKLFFSPVVIVIEELNDLMIVSKKAVEKYIVKIAQLGRACGYHLIIATQHPVVATLTGAIKANIGCRIALQTTSTSDSINILGHKGAERLKGKGDCLLKLPDKADEIHLQAPLITDEEIEKIVKGVI